MLTKIKNIFSSLLQAIPDNIKNANLRVYYGAWVGVLILFLMFVCGWLWNLHETNKADLQIIVQFFGVFTAAITFFSLLGRKVIDKNNDGISDDDEK